MAMLSHVSQARSSNQRGGSSHQQPPGDLSGRSLAGDRRRPKSLLELALLLGLGTQPGRPDKLPSRASWSQCRQGFKKREMHSVSCAFCFCSKPAACTLVRMSCASTVHCSTVPTRLSGVDTQDVAGLLSLSADLPAAICDAALGGQVGTSRCRSTTKALPCFKSSAPTTAPGPWMPCAALQRRDTLSPWTLCPRRLCLCRSSHSCPRSRHRSLHTSHRWLGSRPGNLQIVEQFHSIRRFPRTPVNTSRQTATLRILKTTSFTHVFRPQDDWALG